MSDLPRMPDMSQPKSFWARKEGKVGAVVLIAGLLAAIYFGGPLAITAFGYLTTLLGQAIAITALGSALAILLMIVSNRRVHTLIKLGFQGAMRWLTGIFIELNPIGIMRSYIEDLTKKQGVIDESISALNAQDKKCEASIIANDKQYEQQMQLASKAHAMGNTAQFSIASRQAGRLKELNDNRLKPLRTQMQAHLALLRKYSEVTVVIRTDLENEVNIQEQQREMILASYSAMSAAKRIINGGTDERAMFDDAMQYVADDYFAKIGAIDNFIENSRGFMDAIDLQNGIHEDNALKQLDEWNRQANALLAGTMSAPALTAPAAPVVEIAKVKSPDFSHIAR